MRGPQRSILRVSKCSAWNIPRLALRGLANSTLPVSDDPVKPLRRSPYRLLPLQVFLQSFAPLHIAGWRLVDLDLHHGHASGSAENDVPLKEHEKGVGTLEGKKLIRAYTFPRKGYSDALRMIQQTGKIIEEENVSYTGPSYTSSSNSRSSVFRIS